MSAFQEFVGIVRDFAWICLWAVLVAAAAFVVFDRPRKHAGVGQTARHRQRRAA